MRIAERAPASAPPSPATRAAPTATMGAMAESVFAALLAGRAEALRLLPGRFADPEAWRSAADAASSRRVASPLVDELARQAAGLPRCDARERNLELLGR